MKILMMSVPKAIAVGVYMCINLLFLLKYGGRLGVGYALVLCVVYMAVLHIIYHRWVENTVVRPRWVVVGCILAFVCMICIQIVIDPYSIQVDRWSAIHNFLSCLLQGKYPYAAHTHLGGYGSPFPVWQLLHLPFYAIGNVGLGIFASIAVYLHSLYKWKGNSVMGSACILLACAPGLWYEVAVRSDLISNFLLVAALLQYLIHYKVELDRHIVLFAVGCGLAMSTRLSVFVPIFVFFYGSYLRLNWYKKLCFPLLVAVVFGLTFLPFLLWSDQLWSFEYNPFVLQTSQIHTADVFIITIILIFALWVSQRSVRAYFFSTGVVQASIVMLVFIHNMLLRGDFTALFSSLYDITYFDMSLPFLITFISLSEKNK